MELDWCLGCGRQTVDSDQLYCSKSCFNTDARLSSRPITIPRRRSSLLAFDLPPLSPAATTRKHPSSAPSSPALPAAAFSPFPCSARFADDELRDTTTTTHSPTRWPGKDRHGILLWAHAVSAHHGDDTAEHWAQHSPCSTTRSPFPLTARVPAPPHLSHLNHSPSSASSSSSSSSSSLLTPATDSPPAAADAGRTHLLHKLSAWLAPTTKSRPPTGHFSSSLFDDDSISPTPRHLS